MGLLGGSCEPRTKIDFPICGSALDVFAVEPLADPELWSMPEVLLTPHVGANAVETTLAMAEAAARELADYFRL